MTKKQLDAELDEYRQQSNVAMSDDEILVAVRAGQVLRWLPKHISGAANPIPDLDPDGLCCDCFLGSKLLSDVESMDVAYLSRDGGPLETIRRGGIDYVELREARK